MVLLSGDVHLGEVYKAQCPGLSGQNVLPELTSSGLSHVSSDFFPYPEKIMRFMADHETIDSEETVMELNYGVLEILPAKRRDQMSGDEDVLLRASIRNIHGDERIVKQYTRKDLAFDRDNLLNSRLCIARAAHQVHFRHVLEKLRRILFDSDSDMVIMIFLLPVALASLGLAIALRSSHFLLHNCCQCFSKNSAQA